MNSFVITLSVSGGIFGFLLSFFFYVSHTAVPKKLAQKYWLLYAASQNKLWVDEIYQATVISWFKNIARVFFRFDEAVIDRSVNEVGLKTMWLSHVKNWIDQYLVDGLVNATGAFTRAASGALRLLQTGLI